MIDQELLGTRVGHFRIVDFLGEGGMGSVLAGFDERLHRKVALKVVQGGRLNQDSKARFLREARVLSQLKHPHICEVYDFVETPDRDFLVLELIEGKSLNEFVARGPDIPTKLRIAREFADVLVATHAKSIIHGDLKPANVMVTADGSVKVLDFGLAQAVTNADEVTRSRLDASTSTYSTPSGSGLLTGTLAYMSPEQARGERITTASDLYSYGLVLQELFTGRSAYQASSTAREQLAKSSAGETLPIVGFDGELTALINRLKEPIAAARPTAVDTVEWLRTIEAAPRVRRRRMLAWIAAGFLAVIACGMSYQTWRINRQAHRIAEEAARANREAESARQVSEFMVKLFELSDPGQTRGETVTARELLDKASHDIETRLTEQPFVKARLEMTLAQVYQSLGLYGPALSLAESSLELRRKNALASDPAVAESLREVGVIHYLRGELDAAEPLLRNAAEIQEKSGGPEGRTLAATLNDLAVVNQNQGKIAEAESRYLRALRIYDKVVPDGDGEVAEVLGDLGFLYFKQAKYAQAEPLFLRAIPLLERVGGPNDLRLAIILSQLGGLYRDQGKPEIGEPLFQRSMAIQEKVLGSEHPFFALRLDGMARIYIDEGRYAEAERLLLRALSIFEKSVGASHAWTAQSVENLAIAYDEQGKSKQALDAARRAVFLYETVRGPASVDAAGALVILADVYRRANKLSDSNAQLVRALSTYAKEGSMDAYPRSLQARALELYGRTDEARQKATALTSDGYGRKDFRLLCERLGVRPATH
jgi:eukaryotic-like serine/threonine-protein kinase